MLVPHLGHLTIVLQLLHNNTPGGIGGKELAAPQAGLFASLADGFFGQGNLPLDMVSIGAILGIIILFADSIFFPSTRSNEFKLHLMPIAVGIYLPFGLSTPILAGGLIAHFILKKSSISAKPDLKLQKGVLLSSGLIAGESLVGILLAIIAGLGISKINLSLSSGITTTLTALGAISLIFVLYRYSITDRG